MQGQGILYPALTIPTEPCEMLFALLHLSNIATSTQIPFSITLFNDTTIGYAFNATAFRFNPLNYSNFNTSSFGFSSSDEISEHFTTK